MKRVLLVGALLGLLCVWILFYYLDWPVAVLVLGMAWGQGTLLHRVNKLEHRLQVLTSTWEAESWWRIGRKSGDSSEPAN